LDRTRRARATGTFTLTAKGGPASDYSITVESTLAGSLLQTLAAPFRWNSRHKRVESQANG
jgi:hypothetical protein